MACSCFSGPSTGGLWAQGLHCRRGRSWHAACLHISHLLSLPCRFNTILLLLFLPETKGIPLEQLSLLFQVPGMHGWGAGGWVCSGMCGRLTAALPLPLPCSGTGTGGATTRRPSAACPWRWNRAWQRAQRAPARRWARATTPTARAREEESSAYVCSPHDPAASARGWRTFEMWQPFSLTLHFCLHVSHAQPGAVPTGSTLAGGPWIGTAIADC